MHPRGLPRFTRMLQTACNYHHSLRGLACRDAVTFAEAAGTSPDSLRPSQPATARYQCQQPIPPPPQVVELQLQSTVHPVLDDRGLGALLSASWRHDTAAKQLAYAILETELQRRWGNRNVGIGIIDTVLELLSDRRIQQECRVVPVANAQRFH